jgi:tetratricopeptide (TPR) repeat protein
LESKNDVPERAIGYYKNMTGKIEDNSHFNELPNPDGGFQSTAEDVLKFYQEFHYGNKLLKNETKQKDDFYKMIQAHQNTGGAIPHAGGFEGANTVNFEILRDHISIVVMANMDEPVAEQLGAGILDIIRNKVPQQPSLPAIMNIYKAYTAQGIEFVRENFVDLTQNFHPTDPKALILNNVGYQFLQNNQFKEAIEIFQLNTELFPDDANVWDSLGEGYLRNGDVEKAKTNYQMALKLDPEMPTAIEALKQLMK